MWLLRLNGIRLTKLSRQRFDILCDVTNENNTAPLHFAMLRSLSFSKGIYLLRQLCFPAAQLMHIFTAMLAPILIAFLFISFRDVVPFIITLLRLFIPPLYDACKEVADILPYLGYRPCQQSKIKRDDNRMAIHPSI